MAIPHLKQEQSSDRGSRQVQIVAIVLGPFLHQDRNMLVWCSTSPRLAQFFFGGFRTLNFREDFRGIWYRDFLAVYIQSLVPSELQSLNISGGLCTASGLIWYFSL